MTHAPSGRTLRYGELGIGDAAKVKLTVEPAIKTPAQFTFIPQVDAARRRGPQDRRVGQIRHRRASPGHGFRRDHVRALSQAASSRASMNSVLAGAPGIVAVVKLDNAVAVVATESFWRAKQRAMPGCSRSGTPARPATIDSDQLSKDVSRTRSTSRC